jgi:lanthanide-dependent methanol dehydrogenase
MNATMTASLAVVLALSAAVLPQRSQAQAAGAEWTTPSGSQQGTRFSSLIDITPANVATLTEEFSFSTGSRASHQGTS